MPIISLSGIDSSGKGTQIKLLETYFKEKEISYKTIWARGSWTPGIELVKKVVRQDRGFTEEQKDAYRREARSNPGKQKIILFLSILDITWYFGLYYRLIAWSGRILICDRYIWDTLVDFRVNFSGHNFEQWWIWRLMIQLIPEPKPSFLFVISAQQSIERGLSKQEANMESLDVKLQKVEEYKKLADASKWTHILNGNQSSEIMHLAIKEVLGYEN